MCASLMYIDLVVYLFILVFDVYNPIVFYSMIPKMIQVLEFDNIVDRFEINVY